MLLEAGSKLTPAKICQMITDLHCNIILCRVTEKNKPLHIAIGKRLTMRICLICRLQDWLLQPAYMG